MELYFRNKNVFTPPGSNTISQYSQFCCMALSIMALNSFSKSLCSWFCWTVQTNIAQICVDYGRFKQRLVQTTHMNDTTSFKNKWQRDFWISGPNVVGNIWQADNKILRPCVSVNSLFSNLTFRILCNFCRPHVVAIVCLCSLILWI